VTFKKLADCLEGKNGLRWKEEIIFGDQRPRKTEWKTVELFLHAWGYGGIASEKSARRVQKS